MRRTSRLGSPRPVTGPLRGGAAHLFERFWKPKMGACRVDRAARADVRPCARACAAAASRGPRRDPNPGRLDRRPACRAHEPRPTPDACLPSGCGRDRDEGDFPVVRFGNADLRHEGMRRARRVVEMAAANHRLQHRLALSSRRSLPPRPRHTSGTDRCGWRCACEARPSAGTPPRRRSRAGSGRDPTGRARVRSQRGGQAILGAGQNGAQGFLGVEFGTGRGARLAEVRVDGLHPLKLVVGQFVVERPRRAALSGIIGSSERGER